MDQELVERKGWTFKVRKTQIPIIASALIHSVLEFLKFLKFLNCKVGHHLPCRVIVGLEIMCSKFPG